MRKINLIFALLLSLMGVTQISAQQALPYEYGFEESSPTGWTLTSCHSYSNNYRTGTSGSYNGNYVFRFYWNTNPPQYLITPELAASSNTINVSFWYKAYGSNYEESFKVGYSTTDNQTTSFTWEDEVKTNSTAWTEYNTTFPAGTKYVCIAYTANDKYYLYIDDFKVEENVSGPGLVVKDEGSTIPSGYLYNFGLAAAGQEKTFTLSNPGTEACDVTVAVTTDGDNFGVSPTSASIPAGGEVTLTVTMPDDTTYGDKSGEVTITPSADGLDPIAITVVGTLRDPNKVYLDFADGTMPDGWTSVAIGQYVSSTLGNWTAHVGYICQDGFSTTYASAFTSPKLTFEEGEQILFETAKFAESVSYKPSLTVEYSLDGSTWTAIGSSMTDDIYGTWTQRGVIIPVEGVKYIRFKGYYVNMRNIYGGELPMEPKMVVTQPESLNFGIITAATTKTFTIANTGRVELTDINVASSNAAFTISGAPTSLAAGASQEVTITMSAETTGALSSEITVSATNMEVVKFTVTGVVMPADAFVIDFNDNKLPEGWTNSSWTFENQYAQRHGSSSYLTSPKLSFADTDYFVFKLKASDGGSGDYITIETSNDNGSTWSEIKTLRYNNGDFGNVDADYTTAIISDIPNTVNKIRFKGYYVRIDDITGLVYAPVLSVTKDDDVVATPASYDFGECGSDAIVTYNFANTGAGTINITGVAISGEGAEAYSTNLTKVVGLTNEAPFNLVITRTYNADNAGTAQDATVTVTTSEGDFVINVTGTDKAANAPELSITVGALDFGKVTANATQTVTVTNSGTGSMDVNITSDNELFTLSTATLTEIGAGESKTFDVTFNYPEGNYGSKTAYITVTPTYNEEDAFIIIASANAKDPDVWSEEFEGDGVPAGWTVGDNWTIEDGVAKGLYAYGSNTYLTTPSLTVSSTDDELTFDYAATANFVSIAIQYSKDGGAWTNLNTISGLNNGDADTYTITGLEAGTYQFRFKNDDYNLDNFEGFKLNLADHILSITESNIPTSSSSYPTMKETIAFDATVTVSESRGVNEEVTAKVYMNGVVIGTTTETVNANETNTITIIAIPTEAAVDAAMYIEVTYAGGTLTTETVTRTVAELKKLELVDTEATEITTGTTYDIITLSHSFVKNWNTFVAPLDVNISEFGDGAKVFEFTGYDGTLSFSEVTGSTLTKATPYVVYVPEAIAEVVFTWEDTSIGSMFVGEDNIKVTKGGATFQGTYAPMAAGTLTGKYGVVPSTGRIQKAGSGATMKGFRGYFTLPATSANVSAMFYDADGIITAIEGISIEDGQLNLNGAVDYSKPVYNLSGQRVGREYKGVVIQNGKKIVVK